MPKPIPPHLKAYLSHQDYRRYTDEDQAVWRYSMRQLKDFLSIHAHKSYIQGLEKTGIDSESIPRIEDINKKLKKFGWGAIPVSGFIPPAAFMELQSLGYLPIASEMRNIDHIHYTPAPDIVHEAAGHAPMIINKEYSNYLQKYAEVSSKAIISKEDIDLYEAIRVLSDAKELPGVSPKKIKKLEKDLAEKSQRLSFVSEGGLLSRMNWWTAEYGLIGSLNSPRIYGAGLLSSIGEARGCLKHDVRKIPLGMNCLDYSYDITEPQPQLFVTPSFNHLTKVLGQLAKQMAFYLGGIKALEKCRQARTINTVELDTGLQISGILEDFLKDGKDVTFFKMRGPTQLAYKDREILGHGKSYHSHGYSSPLGQPISAKKCLSKMTKDQLKSAGIRLNKPSLLQFPGGIILSGTPKKIWKKQNKNLIIQFAGCSITYNNEILFHPDWGLFDLALGTKVTSAYGGPADRKAYGKIDSFKAIKVPMPKYTTAQKNKFSFYKQVRDLREKVSTSRSIPRRYKNKYHELCKVFLKNQKNQWLAGIELLELSYDLDDDSKSQELLLEQLNRMTRKNKSLNKLISDGIRIAKKS